jgi:hypothetical protein
MAAMRVVVALSPAKADSLWRSSALRAAAVLGVSGVALACSNLMLARVLPSGEVARFALFFAIAQNGMNIGPFGADVIMTRRHYGPGSHILLNECFLAVRNAV